MAEARTMDSGRTSSLPLVLIHAFPMTAEMWRPQRDALRGEIPVYTPDLPGFGAAPGLDEEALTMDTLAGYVEHLLDAHGIDRCVLGGLSMGGYVALACMRSMRARIAGLILADTKAAPDDEDGRKSRISAIERIGSGDYEGFCDALIVKLLAESTRKSKPDVVANVRRIMASMHPETASAAVLGMLARPDSRDILPTFDIPTAVIVGEHDAITNVDEARSMVEAIPDATLHIIPDAGHISNLENPDAFNAAVRELVARVGEPVLK
ncbi:MAG: alpha/beta fold hydrolase [bacterium]|nr:alpha/beta fold hydrolase [Candidatus Kapabacteria bacterium]